MWYLTPPFPQLASALGSQPHGSYPGEKSETVTRILLLGIIPLSSNFLL
jgi:hypothetical protein